MVNKQFSTAIVKCAIAWWNDFTALLQFLWTITLTIIYKLNYYNFLLLVNKWWAIIFINEFRNQLSTSLSITLVVQVFLFWYNNTFIVIDFTKIFSSFQFSMDMVSFIYNEFRWFFFQHGNSGWTFKGFCCHKTATP